MAEVGSVAGPLRGTVRVGVVESIDRLCVPKLLTEFHSQ